MQTAARTLAAITMVAAGLIAPSAAAADDELDWGPCPFDAGDSGAECTTLPVPVDYHDPSAGTIDMAVSRVRAADPEARRGVLVTNLGGPGTHLGSAAWFSTLAPEAVTDAYDVVSFDQRGFGHSSPVSCELPADQQQLIPWPRQGGFDESVRVARQVADTCVRQGGPLLAHMGTAYVARDMDLMRQALGAERISYLGISYGSYLGTAYASLFGEHTDRVLLESVASAGRMWRGHWQRSIGPATDRRFQDFAEYVGDDGAYDHYVSLAERLGREPLTAPDGVLGGGRFRFAIYSALYEDENFPLLEELGRAVASGDAETAVRLAGRFGAGRADPTGRRAASLLGVTCGDGQWPRSTAVYRFQAWLDAARYPLTAGTGSNIWACAFWPYEVDERVRADPEGPRNILIMNNTRDHATPLTNARELRASFGERAQLVTVEAGGHGAYLWSANTCARDIGTGYLIGGPLPGRDLSCPPEPR
ncbi:alpha/beta fold hydrolase [Amycolatopsis aidingensis]|uniref:alpha/beta fold hydrolase n=1 Tax=Amycolatopsis aidingensis TaxID=2842453 RepID=UPI001C0D672F|nr:alpha/beta fold hydrolase [Amycolatopsis aidingensis]